MKFIFLLCLQLTWRSFLFSQSVSAGCNKPVLDTDAFKTWETIGGGQISDDGNYVSYSINNPSGGEGVLVIQSTSSSWKKEFSRASSAAFSSESKRIVFKSGKDSLLVLTLGTDTIDFRSDVGAYEMPKCGKGLWCAYTVLRPKREVILRDLITGRESAFPSVVGFKFNDSASFFLMERLDRKDNQDITSLQLMSLPNGKLKSIWSAHAPDEKVTDFSFDDAGNQVVFLVGTTRGAQIQYGLWYFHKDMDTAVMLVNGQSKNIPGGYLVADLKPRFSGDGKLIFFGLESTDHDVNHYDVSVDVWSGKDTQLQSIQLNQVKGAKVYSTAINIKDRGIISLEREQEHIISSNNDFALIAHDLGSYGQFEAHWNKAAQSSFYLVSLKDGTRKLVRDCVSNPQGTPALSPCGKWILYYDFTRKNYFSYNVSTGVSRNVTKDCPTIWTEERNGLLGSSLPWVPWLNTWLKNDESVLIYDNYDIWQIDPTGSKTPVNITNGYGRRHGIKFEILNTDDIGKNGGIQKNATIILRAINTSDESRGFYSKTLGIRGDPEFRSIGPYVYGMWGGHGLYNYPLVKAKQANCYLVPRMSATEAPNYFTTHNFREFRQLSNIQPQKNYNWLTAKLIHWRTFDGTYSTGILYEPENFDPKKKYPLLLNYYEIRSDELNLYRTPAPASGQINIPWFVSNGYLVFIPDIHYKIGKPGQSIYNAVVSAAIYLSKMPWVDAKKMGIQGHSFGGYETNYLVTHTSIFAAACTVSGISDLISWYGSGARGGFPIYHVEQGQGRLGYSLWQRPESYIKNSPIFYANRVTLPLLIVHDKGDIVVPFSQGLELFTALRRLHKKVWMLQYDGSGHSVEGSKATEDFTIRMTQFFDHYLKGMPAPQWMTKGIRASMKGIDSGLEIDSSGRVP